MTDVLVSAFIILLVVVDPIGVAPIFGALVQGGSDAYKRRMAVQGTVLAATILALFGVVGAQLLALLGIGLPAFRIAGGLLLLLLAIDMVFARHSGLRSTTVREQQEAETRQDISVFPLAFPLIAGPGSITTVILLVGQSRADPWALLGLAAVLTLVLALTLLCLLLAPRIMRVLGETGTNVVSRILGVLLSALAVQFVLDGLAAGLLLS